MTADVQLRVYDRDLTTFLGTVDEAYDVEYQDDRLTVGRGQFTVRHDAASVQATPGLLNGENLVVCRRTLADGVTTVDEFAWQILSRQRDQGQTSDPISVQGLGLKSILGTAVVSPHNGFDTPVRSDTRLFGWMSLGYDDSAWETGLDIASLGSQESPDPPNFLGYPADWPDPRAEWIWSEPPVGSPLEAPPGRVYFRFPRTIGAGAAGPVRICLAGVNGWTFYFDEEDLGRGGGWKQMSTFDVELFDGADHVLAAKVYNIDRSAAYTGQNVGALLVTVLKLDENGEPAGVLFRSRSAAGSGWRALGYPATTPGVTKGFILTTLFDEAQAEGALSALTRDFDEDVDSAGNPWSEETEFPCQIGNDTLLSVCERMRNLETPLDFDVTPGRVFRAWENRGVDRGATPAGGAVTVTVPLGKVQGKRLGPTEDRTTDVLKVRSSEGWQQRPASPAGTGLHQDFLSLGLIPSNRQAARIADADLADHADPFGVCTWRYHSETEGVPDLLDAADLADVIEGPWLSPADEQIVAEWALADVRLDSWTVTLTDSGRVRVSVEVSEP